jgi:hypothetical protein
MRRLKLLFQKITRGWDDRDTWGLCYTIARFILPRLKRFREIIKTKNAGIPVFSHKDFKYDREKKKWLKILDDMIYAFECCADEEFDTPYTFDKESGIDEKGNVYGIHCYEIKQEKRDKRIQKGLKYFSEYFGNLWW